MAIGISVENVNGMLLANSKVHFFCNLQLHWLITSCTLLLQLLLQLIQAGDLCPIHLFLHNFPDTVLNRVTDLH